MDNNLLISNILMLKRKLKIKVSKEIQGLELFEALQLEVRSLKAYQANSPNLVEIGAIVFSAVAIFVSSIAFYGSFIFDTSYYFSSTKDGSSPVEVGLATYLIKNSPDEKIINIVDVVYFAVVMVFFIGAWILIRQIRLLRKIKELEMLDYYLEMYIGKNENRKKTNIYPNMNNSISKVDIYNFK
ncbi:hypothetical protein ABIA69_001917 [Lysinibacillus parviboronicapiens]|uniref:Uncharacterized protein n=1 Tax=Lysinibacillus parviboronicapiens TaxID=436516 RepID=A0ABV2PII9_9BACI